MVIDRAELLGIRSHRFGGHTQLKNKGQGKEEKNERKR